MSEQRNPDRECPFCGSPPTMRYHQEDERSGYSEYFTMTCIGCSATATTSCYEPYPRDGSQDREERIQMAHNNWNRRFTPKPNQ